MNYYEEIKKQLIDNEVTKKVKEYSKNRSDLNTYYNVGKILSEAGKCYGEGIIKEYSIRLTREFGRGYSTRSLKYMRKYYLFQKGQPIAAQLTWSHYIEILKINDTNEINYYIKMTITQKLSRNELRNKIKNKEYQRLDEQTKLKLINNEEEKIEDLIKNPIVIKNINNIEIVKEKTLQKLILEDIPSFLEELGNGFTFIKNEYKIKIGDRYNYIDLLLYNIKYKCYVVVELKVTELKKEHIGYIDNNLKTIEEDITIGIIICKKDNKYIMRYCSDERIISKEYELV